MGSFLSKPKAPPPVRPDNFAVIPPSRGGLQRDRNLRKSTLATGPQGLLGADENTGTLLN